MTTAGVAASVVAAVIVAATLADGRTSSQTDTHDGGAWLLNRDAGAIGHVDRLSGEISGSVRVSEPYAGFDVHQAAGVVVVHDFSSGSATLVDEANYSPSSSVAAPDTLQVRAREQGLVVIDDDPISIRHVSISDLADLEELTDAPVALQGEGPGLGVIDRAGRTVLADASGTVRAEDADGEVRTTQLGTLEARPSQLTVVGDTVVVLTEEGELRSVASGSTTLDPPGDLRAGDWTLQQPSPAATEVVAISPDGVVRSVDLSDGAVTEVRELAGGLPVEPIVHGGCTFTLVTQPVMFTRICGDQVLEDDLGLDGRSSGQLRLRLVNGWVWINDVDSGASWVTDTEADVARIDDWDIALAEQEGEGEDDLVDDGAADEQRENPDDAEVISPLDLLDLSGPNEPPVARPDTAATRDGRPVVVDVLENDTDPNGDVLLLSDVANRSSEDAVVTISGDRTSVQVVPAGGFTGTVRFSYTITDGRGGTADAEVTVNVTPLDPGRNRSPQLVTDVASVRAGESVTLSVLANDRDPDGDRLRLVDVTGEGIRTTFSPDGLVTLTPDPDQQGRIELEYVAADEFGATAAGRILLDVRLPDSNLEPVARNDAGQTVVANRIVLNVLANDSDPDGDGLIVQSQPQLLQAPTDADPFIHLDADGRLDFEPEVAGTYVLMYTISDGSLTGSALIRIEVGPPDDNRPPVAVRDDVLVPVGGSRIVPVLVNDADPDGDVLSIVDWIGAPGLDVQLVEGDRFRVTAQPSAPPVTSFRYTISDGVNQPVSTIVSVLMVDEAAVLPPVAQPDELEVRAGQVSTVDVLENDHDPAGGALRVTGVSEPEGASVGITGDQQQVVLDVPASSDRGFTVGYEIENDQGERAASTVEVRIVPPDDPNRAPIAGTDIARSLEARPVVIDVLANDRDPDGDPLVLEGIARQPANGSVEVLEDDRLQYSPDRGFAGTDRFAYSIVDTGGLRTTGEVLVGVTEAWEENRPPQAQDDTSDAVAGGDAVTINVLANDIDPDGDPLTVVDVDEVRLGDVQLAGDGGAVVFVPPESIEGSEAEVAFTYRVDDGRGGQNEAVVTVTISEDEEEALPEPPQAVDDRVGPVPAGERITIDVLSNDRLPANSLDGLALTASDPTTDIVGDQFSLLAPEATSTYRYTITDAFEQSSSAIVTVEVSPNSPPVVDPLTVETELDGVLELDLTGQASDPDGDELFFACCDTLRGGSATVTSADARSLTVRFEPTAAAGSRAAFSYTVDDQQGHQVAGSVSIDIQAPEDQPPAARDTDVEVEADGTRSVDLRALVDDDRPEEELRFSTESVTGPLEVSADGGTLRLRADLDAAGATGTVAYTVTDAAEQSDSGSVRVRITPTSAPLPQARVDEVTLLQGEPLVVRVLDNDIGDGLRVVGAGGSATLSAEVDDDGSSVRLTPDDGFFGSTIGSYTVRDRFDDPEREVDGRIEVTVIGRPDAPASPRVSTDSGLATLVWDAPASNGAPIDRYEVEHGQGDSRELDRTSTYTWTGLTNGTEYRFRVRAGNEAGWSDWSVASAPVVPDQVPGRPGVPSVAFGDGELDVTWQRPSNDGSSITSYVLEIGGATTGVRDLPATGGQSQSYTWTGLANGANHTFRVKAVNAADEGGGDFSGWSEPEHPLTQPSAPSAPTLENGPNYLDVNWGRSNDGGDAIQEYEIQIDSASGRTVRVSGANTTSYRWGELTNGVDHRFRVRAWNRDTRGGEWSAFSEPGRACDVPTKMATPVLASGDRSVTISWQAPPANGCELTGFELTDVPGLPGAEISVGGTPRSYTVNGLTNGIEYAFVVRALNEQGAGEWSAFPTPVVPAGPPTAPRIVSVTPTAEEELTITWERADPNGSPITRYEWRGNGAPTSNAGDTTSIVHTGLTSGLVYGYEVRAVNDVGAGPWSTAQAARAEGRPGSVGSLRESASTTSSLTWNWTAPASDGGSPLTGYQVGRGETGSPVSIGTSPRSYTWGSLSADRTYRLYVRACNRWGCGAWQDATGRTDAPPQPSISISYGAQSNVTGCSASTCRRIEVAARNFQPNTSYTVVCHDARDASYYSYDITTNGSGDSNSNTCRNGEVGVDNWVTIGSVRSNTIRQ